MSETMKLIPATEILWCEARGALRMEGLNHAPYTGTEEVWRSNDYRNLECTLVLGEGSEARDPLATRLHDVRGVAFRELTDAERRSASGEYSPRKYKAILTK